IPKPGSFVLSPSVYSTAALARKSKGYDSQEIGTLLTRTIIPSDSLQQCARVLSNRIQMINSTSRAMTRYDRCSSWMSAADRASIVDGLLYRGQLARSPVTF
ncbi:hypothetical protein EV363DRAFT_1159537, partial [Boletus edulis]